MLTCFWSPCKGQSKTTTNAMIIAIMNVIKYRRRVLFINTDNNQSAEKMLLSQMANNIYNDIGIDAFLRYSKMGIVEDKFVNDITLSFQRNLLHIMSGSNKNLEDYENIIENLNFKIFTSLLDYYDNIYIDLPSGNNKISKYFLSKCHNKVINLSQSKIILDSILFNDIEDNLINDNTIFLLGSYHKNSTYTVKNIMKLYPQLNKKVLAIPYCTELMDSISNSKLLSFLQNINLSEDEFSVEFIKTIEEVLKRLDSIKGEGKLVN